MKTEVERNESINVSVCHCNCLTRFGPKVGQIGPKWDISGDFSDQIQYILAREPKCTESDLKTLRIFPIWDQSDLLWAQIWFTRAVNSCCVMNESST